MPPKGYSQYLVETWHWIDGQQQKRVRVIYRASDDEAKDALVKIHDEDPTAHEGIVTHVRSGRRVFEFSKFA